MTLRFVLSALALTIVTACTDLTSPSGVHLITQAESNDVRARHVDLINALRAERGLQPVQLSAQLTAAARTHALDMSNQKRAWHFGSDGTSPKDRAQRAGYGGQVLSENISESTDNEIEVFQSWVSDPVTQRVMLHPRANAVGFGWHQEPSGKLWWVQVFGGSAPGGFTPGS